MKLGLITAISLVAPFILWGKLIFFPLAQDDYYLISQAVFNSAKQQFLASLPSPDSVFFRPLGIQSYFYLTARLFGITAWKYRIAAMLIQGINSILVYKISQKILKSGAVFVWIMYLTAPWQFAAVGWIVNISYLTGAMFAFLSILSALEKRFSHSILLFALGILTNELVVAVPVLLYLLNFVRKKRLMIPMIIILGLYGVFRLQFPSATSGDYGFKAGFNVVQNIRWLLMWTLGWPETYKDQFTSLYNINGSFLSVFFLESLLFLVTTMTVLGIVIARTPQRRGEWQSKSIKNYGLLLFGISWFITALSPVIFFNSHIYPHYAVIAGAGIYMIIAEILSRSPQKFKTVFILLWITQFISGLKINLATHWWPRHALEAGRLTAIIKNKYPSLPPDKNIWLEVNDPREAELVLAGDSAVKLIYNDADAKLTIVRKTSVSPNFP